MDIFEEACIMGREMGKFAGKVNKELEPNGDVDELFESWENGIVQDADYANNILPKLRQLAGCKDPHGIGTFTDCTDEQWELFNELAQKFWECAYEGFVEGFEKG